MDPFGRNPGYVTAPLWKVARKLQIPKYCQCVEVRDREKGDLFLREMEAPMQRLNELLDLLNQGRYEEVEAQARTLISDFPLSGEAWMILGVSLESQGKASLSALQRATRLQPENAATHCNLGVAEQRLGHSERAIASYLKAVAIDPDFLTAHYNLGLALQQSGRHEEAAAEFRHTTRIQPDHFEAHFQLGLSLQNAGHIPAAVDVYRNATQYNSEYSHLYYNLAVGLQVLELPLEALEQYQKALEVEPEFPDVLNNMATIYREMGQADRAIEYCIKALAVDPTHYKTNLHLNSIYMDRKQLVDSELLCQTVLKIKPDFAEMRQNLSRTLTYLCDYEKVVDQSNQAFRDKPDQVVMWEQRLYCFSYHPDLSSEEIFQEFVRWGDRFADPAVDFSAHNRNPHRRLRIGYVSPDFRSHSSRFYFWPLFQNHDREAFELFAYSNVQKEVAWTRLFKGQFEHWRDIKGFADAAVADMIRDDGIDILVDLCGHMLDERLGVFALKPAPIQVTWLGSSWTTGLKTMDYALFDRYMAPEGTLTRESIVHLPHSFLVFQPPIETADLIPPPCLDNGYITFGYTGRTERLNHRTFKVWGEILRRLPEARLILDYPTFADPKTQAYYQTTLAQHGVDTERVLMRRSPQIFQGLNDIDILLDSFPHGGGTMLMDAFWMGVPPVSLASRPPVGRLGMGMLMNLGLPEWVAFSEEEFIEKACGFARDFQALRTLRLGMRVRMMNSPLMDGPGFARGVESAFRNMFERWVEVTTP